MRIRPSSHHAETLRGRLGTTKFMHAAHAIYANSSTPFPPMHRPVEPRSPYRPLVWPLVEPLVTYP